MCIRDRIRTTIDLKRLEAISNSEYKKVTRSLRPTTASSASYDTAERRVHFSQQIDVRGMRASEALDATQEFIDDAIMLGFSEVRILHGKGTGALKEEIRKYLRTVDLVASAKDEHEESGGAGITAVSYTHLFAEIGGIAEAHRRRDHVADSLDGSPLLELVGTVYLRRCTHRHAVIIQAVESPCRIAVDHLLRHRVPLFVYQMCIRDSWTSDAHASQTAVNPDK